jgi:hypothetical protein
MARFRVCCISPLRGAHFSVGPCGRSLGGSGADDLDSGCTISSRSDRLALFRVNSPTRPRAFLEQALGFAGEDRNSS